MQSINRQERKKRLRLTNILFPFLTALLFALSFAPSHPIFRFLIFVAFLPYLHSILRVKKKIFFSGFIFGFLSNACIFWWITAVNVQDVSRILVFLGVLLMIFYLSCYWGLVAVLTSRLKKFSITLAIFSFPFFWVSLEFIRSLTREVGFPWGSVGYSLSNIPSLIQLASISGVAGISFFVLLCNSLIYWSLRQQSWKKRMIGVSGFILLLLLSISIGNYVMKKNNEQKTVRVSLIQANILPEIKRANEEEERISTLEELTLKASECGSDLIVWSETSIPCYYREGSQCINKIKELVEEGGIPVIAGAPEYVPGKKRSESHIYNSAFLISGEGKTEGKYRKIYLVPFGEHLPFDNTFPFLTKIHLGQGDFSPGDNFTVLNQGTFRFSVLICFEAIFPRLVRRFVRNNAELLVNITEDSWYGRTAGPYQHAEMAIFRAVENRISVARCANSGISMLIDPYGRVLKKSKIFERTIVDGEIPLRNGYSFYTRFGDLFAWLIVAVSFVLFVFSFTPIFRRQ